MGKAGPIFQSLLFMICLAMPPMVFCTIKGEDGDVDQWFQKLRHAKQKLTHLHFYFHTVAVGPNPTSVVVAQATTTVNSPTMFGQVSIFDNLLTKGPESTSEPLGRAQGLFGFASQEQASILMAFTFVFTSREYNGSSITVLGRNSVLESVREMPIVGGTGVFRLARGFATARTYFYNGTVDIAEYNVVAQHF